LFIFANTKEIKEMDHHDIITDNFPDLTDLQISQFKKLKDLYVYWNEKINVISRKDMDNFYLHHVLHSLSIAKIVRFKAHTEIMDAGTGGGFPGIPLAIMFPDVKFYLVDSIGKKIKVVNEVVNELNLKNVKAEQLRMEQVKGTFDFIISRAVTTLPEFLKWTSYKFHNKSFNSISNGVLYIKGGDIHNELKELKKLKNKVFNIPNYFDYEYFITKKIVHIYRR
jgi:16S rRNA (guanine527-N7)-methyltransferase